MTILVPIFVLLAVVPLIRHRDRAGRALALRRAGLGWMAVFALFFGAFIIGYTVDDPGGWTALLLVASWVAPLVALSWVAWSRPQWALPVLGWRRPLPAAVLLLVATVLPMVFNILGSGAPLSAAFGGSLSAATAPGAVTGMLYLLSVIFERQSVAHPAPPNAAPTPA